MKFTTAITALLLGIPSLVAAGPVPSTLELDTRKLDTRTNHAVETRELAARTVPPTKSAAYLLSAAQAAGKGHLIAPNFQYAIKEACKNVIDGVHCRLVIGKTSLTTTGALDWKDVYFHDLIYDETDKTKSVKRSRLWAPAVAGPSKYSPEYLGVVSAKETRESIDAKGQEIINQYPMYCMYAHFIPGVMAGTHSKSNCFSYCDALWAKLK